MPRRACLVLLPWLLLSACAHVGRDERLHRWASDFVYPEPVAQVWPRVETFFKQKGYSARRMEGRPVLITEWREAFHGSLVTGAFTRYYVEARPVGPGSCIVRVLRYSMFTGGKARPRQGGGQDLVATYAADPDEINVNNFGESYRSRQQRFSRDVKTEWELLQFLEPEVARARLEQDPG